MEFGRDNPSYFLSDGDRVRPKPGPRNYNLPRDSKRSGGTVTCLRQYRKSLAITICTLLVIFLVVFLILFFSLPSGPEKKRQCRKFYEAEIVTIEFECRFWAVLKDVIENDQLKDNNQIQKNKICNCTRLSAFWKWWNKNFDYLNKVLKKFQLVEDSECHLTNLQISDNSTVFKDSNICTTVILTIKTHNIWKELAFVTSDAGFKMVLIDKNNVNFVEKTPIDYLHKKNFDVFDKIDHYFRSVDDCSGEFRIRYAKTSDYNRRLSNEGVSNAEEGFVLYPENKYCVMLPDTMKEEKIAHDFSEASKQLAVFADVSDDDVQDVSDYNDNHETSDEDFDQYFKRRLHEEKTKKNLILTKAMRKLTGSDEDKISYRTCLKLWKGECLPSEERMKFVVVVYNPSEHPRNVIVKLPVISGEYSVHKVKGEYIPIQTKELPKSLHNLKCKFRKEENGEKKMHPQDLGELVFRTENIPGYGFDTFYVSGVPTVLTDHGFIRGTESQKPLGKVRAILMPSTQDLTAVKVGHREFFLETSLSLYDSSYCEGTLSRYSEIEKPKSFGLPARKGQIVSEYEYVYEGLGSRIVRTYPDEDYLEVEWIFHNLTCFGEIAIQYNTKIKNKGVFYIGGKEAELEMRINNRTECSTSCLVHDNCTIKYYPTQEISIRDSSSQIFIVTETPQSMTNPCPGTIELSILLNSKKDSVMSQKHWIFIGQVDDRDFKSKVQHFVLDNKVEPLLLFPNPAVFSHPYEDWNKKLVTSHSGLSQRIPENIYVVTFERKTDKFVWLRLKNIGGNYEKVNPTNLLRNFNGVKEIFFGSTLFCPSNPEIDNGFPCDEDLDHQFQNGLIVPNVLIDPTQIRSYLFYNNNKDILN